MRTNSDIPVPDLTPCALILGGPSIHDWILPLRPAINAEVADISAIHKPWPQSGSVSVSGINRYQTSTDKPTHIPAIPDKIFAGLELEPIIDLTCITVAANSSIAPTISIIVAMKPALWESDDAAHISLWLVSFAKTDLHKS